MNLRTWLITVFVGRAAFAAVAPVAFEAEEARLNPARAEVVAQAGFRGERGASLKAGAAGLVDRGADDADVVFTLKDVAPGRYGIVTYAATDALGIEQMRKARTKFQSLFFRLQVGDQRPTRRVIFVPWSKPELCVQRAGTFEVRADTREIRCWLPAGVRLDRIELQPYRPPAVPKEAAAYRPTIVPPTAHPRLWVNADSLPQVRARLSHPEHKGAWDAVRAQAAKPFPFAPTEAEIAYNTPLEQAALAKAFCYLMLSDAPMGRQAVDLMLAYLPRVEFGNLLDITREVGAAIYSASCVYDWCYGLLEPAERELLRTHLMRLAEEMECGWPPFRLSIINGHGNEAVINRDLLALSIALYNEDPLPYQYCSYAVLEQLVPMRRFEYQSPRHNQGVSYASFRFGWEMHAAWLFRRMAGREVFDANIKDVPKYWLHMRLPNGEMLRDGDGIPAGKYWSYAQTALLCYAYNGDAVLKGEFLRQGGLPRNPVLFLLLNDPAIKAEPSLAGLPLTIDFGPVLGGMIARTGWTMGADSPDVVAEIKGGGYHFGNHQHADAGSLQIYYRGLQVAKLAQYGFYGTPYDMNFAKRSIAQSMIRVIDPKEPILRNLANDGGTRFNQSNPRTPQQAKSDPAFTNGQVLSCNIGPDARTPDFSYFAVDLRSAYSDKVAAYTRRFVFLNLHDRGNPAAMIVLDDLATSKPELEKLWQLTTLKAPSLRPMGVRLWNESGGKKGQLDVAMLVPAVGDRKIEVISGAEVHRVGGQLFTPPTPAGPEANGHRIVVTPAKPQARDVFLTVLQACDEEPLPVRHEETEQAYIVFVADQAVVMPKGTAALDGTLIASFPRADKPHQVLLTGLGPGRWKANAQGGPAIEFTVEAGRNTAQLIAHGGTWRIAPVRAP